MNESSTMMSFAFSGGYLKIRLILSRSELPQLQWRILAKQGGVARLFFQGVGQGSGGIHRAESKVSNAA